jgi:hypothetical protein
VFCSIRVWPGVIWCIGRYWKKLSLFLDLFFPVLPDAGPGTSSTDEPGKALAPNATMLYCLMQVLVFIRNSWGALAASEAMPCRRRFVSGVQSSSTWHSAALSGGPVAMACLIKHWEIDAAPLIRLDVGGGD